MAMTIQEHKERSARSYKLLLWFAMISMTMMFAGLTSAYVVSKSRTDWMKDFQMPVAFFISTALILICSLTFLLAKKAIKKDDRNTTTLMLFTTLVAGSGFVYFQLDGFHSLAESGAFPVGGAGSITISFLYIIVLAHLAHLAGGIISLLIIIYNHFKQKYNSGQTLGIELGAMYWHFLDFLWLYLFLFLYFFK
ncbi:cytochrome c oxidase subunit 3 [uncultured Flavobacterium sp.]|uniref:cytochrome c oxidase subunit 3 n=1 Tax=uncultured Flavobacterium sp. TaxID=165435 RepID=UPI0025F17544|nr:cytochrome c oxidase subunit 3 [uncultured Flavobacterium sp.]